MKQKLDELRTLAVKLFEAGQTEKRRQSPEIWGEDRNRKFRDLPSESVKVWDAVALAALPSRERKVESFHPLQDADVLNQPGSMLRDYRVGDNRSRTLYISQRLLHVALLTYLKHHKGEDVIGWDALGDELHAAICEAIGDDEFCKWNDTTSKA
jgi:hypothetical protein